MQASITTLCSQMSGMPGCYINTACLSNPNILSFPYCTVESIYSDICAFDMPSMSSCKPFSSTCSSANCTSLPNLPTSKTITQQIYSICNEMNMDGCSNCKISSPDATYSDCNLMQTYGRLCKSMPNMSQCSYYKNLCSNAPNLDICIQNNSYDPPAMKMYFHTGIRDYVLFENIVPETEQAYAGLIVFIFLFSALYEGYQVIYVYVLDWVEILAPKGVVVSVKARVVAGACRALARVIGATWSYLLMLIVMNFNVGMFIAVVFGLGFGSAIFGPHHSRSNAVRVVELQNAELCC